MKLSIDAARDPLPWWFHVLLIVLGLGCLAGAALLWQGTARFVGTAQRTQGVLAGYEEAADSGTSPLYYPVISFEAGGREYSFRTGVASSARPYAAGQALPVLYDPANPKRALLDRGMELWFAPAICALIGLLLTGGGIATYLVFGRKRLRA
jgi:hypothetical protein